MQHPDEAPHLRSVERIQISLVQQKEQQVESVRVVSQRRWRKPALMLQRIKVFFD